MLPGSGHWHVSVTWPNVESMNTAAAPRRNRILLLLVLGAVVVVVAIIVSLVVSSSGARGPYRVIDSTITIESATIGSFGTVLVTDQGFALYTFPPDAQARVTCTDRCAVNWPPMIVPKGVQLVAGLGVNAAQLSETTGDGGTGVATYDGWPLYTYSGDVTAGTANGQGQYLDGGYWYVIRPNGEIVMPGK